MQTDTALRRLGTLSTLARAGKRADGLFRLLTCRLLWTEGLERIKRNKGAQTSGIDGSSVLGLGETDIEALIQALMEGSYRPMPVRRVYIPKTNGKLRPLGIPMWEA
jgi:retron-type reverse transcriptase